MGRPETNASFHEYDQDVRRARKRKASDLVSDGDYASPNGRVVSALKPVADGQGSFKSKKITLKVPRPMCGIEIARNRFYIKHRDVFSALISPESGYFTTLEDTMQWHRPFDLVPYERLLEQPQLIKNGEMKDYQLSGLSQLVYWHKNGVNGILGDEVGLGKSIQTLSLFAYIRHHEPIASKLPHLIICPLSVIHHWITETRKWIPSFKIVRLHGSEKDRKEIKKMEAKNHFDVLVTNYECAKLENSWLKSCRWDYVVLDEGHRIKNNETRIAGMLQTLNSRHRLILSGTAIQNELLELWSLLHWLHSSIFTDSTAAAFKDAFKLSAGKYDFAMIEASRNLLNLIMLRRTKDEVELSVPPKDERMYIQHPIALDGLIKLQKMQKRCYLILLQGMDMQPDLSLMAASKDSVKRIIKDSFKYLPGQWKELQNLLMRLRRLCDHPFLIHGTEPADNKDTIVPFSSKFLFLQKLFESVLPKRERILIFSQFVDTLELIKEFCELRNVKCAVLEGSTPRARRSLDIRLFQENEFFDVYLISTKAGGQGITLTRAKHVVLFDSSWNPQDDLQAIGRAHRIGQTEVVKVYRLICKDSVEDQMLERLQKKLYLSAKLNSSDSSQFGGNNQTLEKPRGSDLISILWFGSGAAHSHAKSLEDFAKFQASSFDDIIGDSQELMKLRLQQIQQRLGEKLDDVAIVSIEEEERRLLQGVTQVQTKLFEGKIHNRSKDLSTGLESASEHVSVRATPKRAEEKKLNEDYCILCRGEYAGTAFLCDSCPRVFHPRCAGISRHQGPVTCPQHRCRECGASTEAAGGLLYRCRTCAYATCEECLPPKHQYKLIGNELPEFKVLGWSASRGVFYIQCPECIEYLAANPDKQAEWSQEWDMAEVTLKSRLEN